MKLIDIVVWLSIVIFSYAFVSSIQMKLDARIIVIILLLMFFSPKSNADHKEMYASSRYHNASHPY